MWVRMELFLDLIPKNTNMAIAGRQVIGMVKKIGK